MVWGLDELETLNHKPARLRCCFAVTTCTAVENVRTTIKERIISPHKLPDVFMSVCENVSQRSITQNPQESLRLCCVWLYCFVVTGPFSINVSSIEEYQIILLYLLHTHTHTIRSSSTHEYYFYFYYSNKNNRQKGSGPRHQVHSQSLRAHPLKKTPVQTAGRDVKQLKTHHSPKHRGGL